MNAGAVLWTDTAIEDLGAIVDHIAADAAAAALAVLDQLQARAATLATLAARGRIVPELREIGITHYRELIERPWRLLYRMDAASVFVVAVLDSRRELDTVLLERLTRC
jgi:plasmid stabilization system protein ParE